MASWSSSLPSGALRVLSLCLLALLPVFMADRGMLVGGWRDRSASDPDVQKAAAFAEDAYNKASNSLFYCRAEEILKAQSQVVEGIKYYLKISLVNTQCEKTARRGLTHVDLGRCTMPPEAEQQKQICKFYIWSRPWLNDTRLSDMSCGPASS
ncbi:cystatin-like [Eublepharis macularius]|uniref:Cystatin-like n=2 Tax=Eublepharis macularius TaxID=481883 RepID=A0AA97KGY8_EUBMA|nr:cystatin-like [Eublepharis macularius]